MPSIRYYNQTAPFWDFVAGLEDRGASHPFFADRRHHHPYHHHGHHEEQQSPQEGGPSAVPTSSEKAAGDGADPPESVPTGQCGAAPHGFNGPPPYMRGCHGRRGRGGCGPGGRRGFGGWAGGPRMWTGPFAMQGLADFINSQFLGNDDTDERGDGQQHGDFKPEVDVFDTENEFIIHVSLAGAKKEDVSVNWDAEKSELRIGGVIVRPGDEDFLKTLALDERKIGAFEKNVRLGSRANPAQVDADMITAKLEEGVLQVTVPKLDKDYVEVKKVEIE